MRLRGGDSARCRARKRRLERKVRVIHKQKIAWRQEKDPWIRYRIARIGKPPVNSRLRYPSTLGVLEWLTNTFVLDGWVVPQFEERWRKFSARTK